MSLFDEIRQEEDDDEAPVLPKRRMRADTEMDMTPMIDCTFLLLIFFVVSAKFEPETAVQLPPARYGVSVDPTKCVILTVAAEGESGSLVYPADGKKGAPLEGDEQSQAEQIQDLVEAGMLKGRDQVLIKAERGIKHREVARVAAAATQADGVTLNVAVLEIGTDE